MQTLTVTQNATLTGTPVTPVMAAPVSNQMAVPVTLPAVFQGQSETVYTQFVLDLASKCALLQQFNIEVACLTTSPSGQMSLSGTDLGVAVLKDKLDWQKYFIAIIDAKKHGTQGNADAKKATTDAANSASAVPDNSTNATKASPTKSDQTKMEKNNSTSVREVATQVDSSSVQEVAIQVEAIEGDDGNSHDDDIDNNTDAMEIDADETDPAEADVKAEFDNNMEGKDFLCDMCPSGFDEVIDFADHRVKKHGQDDVIHVEDSIQEPTDHTYGQYIDDSVDTSETYADSLDINIVDTPAGPYIVDSYSLIPPEIEGEITVVEETVTLETSEGSHPVTTQAEVNRAVSNIPFHEANQGLQGDIDKAYNHLDNAGNEHHHQDTTEVYVVDVNVDEFGNENINVLQNEQNVAVNSDVYSNATAQGKTEHIYISDPDSLQTEQVYMMESNNEMNICDSLIQIIEGDQQYDPNIKSLNESDSHPSQNIVCTMCDTVCATQHELRKHMLVHTGNVVYQCEKCDKTFAHKIGYSKHMKKHGVDPKRCINVECKICGKLCKQNSLWSHMRRHKEDKPLKCKYCDKRFFGKLERTWHERSHTGERPYKCDKCDKCFVKKAVLDNHYKSAHGDPTLLCDLCGKYFPHKDSLRVHKKAVHFKKDQSTLCTICGKKISTPLYFKWHMQSMHGDGYEHICNVCGKPCRTNADLKDHMNVHTGAKSYKCEKCNTSYQTYNSLAKHRRTKTHKKNIAIVPESKDEKCPELESKDKKCPEPETKKKKVPTATLR